MSWASGVALVVIKCRRGVSVMLAICHTLGLPHALKHQCFGDNCAHSIFPTFQLCLATILCIPDRRLKVRISCTKFQTSTSKCLNIIIL
jgi:hypothetical protein